MQGERFKAEEIVDKIRRASAEFVRGSAVVAMWKLLVITDAT